MSSNKQRNDDLTIKLHLVFDFDITTTRTLPPNSKTALFPRQVKFLNHISHRKTSATRKNTCRAKENHQQSPSNTLSIYQAKRSATRRPRHGRRQACFPPRHRPHPRVSRRHGQPAQQPRNRKPDGRCHADHRALASELRALRCPVPASFCESGKAV